MGKNEEAAATQPGSGSVTQESSLDEETLQQIADITNAKFYRATDTEGLRDIYTGD